MRSDLIGGRLRHNNIFLTIHLEFVHVDLLQVKLPLTILEELADVIAGPGSRIRRKSS